MGADGGAGTGVLAFADGIGMGVDEGPAPEKRRRGIGFNREERSRKPDKGLLELLFGELVGDEVQGEGGGRLNDSLVTCFEATGEAGDVCKGDGGGRLQFAWVAERKSGGITKLLRRTNFDLKSTLDVDDFPNVVGGVFV